MFRTLGSGLIIAALAAPVAAAEEVIIGDAAFPLNMPFCGT